jgi:hypothetical protein
VCTSPIATARLPSPEIGGAATATDGFDRSPRTSATFSAARAVDRRTAAATRGAKPMAPAKPAAPAVDAAVAPAVDMAVTFDPYTIGPDPCAEGPEVSRCTRDEPGGAEIFDGAALGDAAGAADAVCPPPPRPAPPAPPAPPRGGGFGAGPGSELRPNSRVRSRASSTGPTAFTSGGVRTCATDDGLRCVTAAGPVSAPALE